MCDILAASHKDRFEEVLSLTGRKRPYFTKNPNELKAPERIAGTDIYVETNLSADRIGKISFDMISLFGYSAGDLSIEAQ
jgi:negative regulator of replication initiation